MSNEIEKFEFNGSQLRVVMIDGEPWFVAKDVTDMLGFKNGRSAIEQHVLPGQTTVSRITTPSRGLQSATVINEAGLYRLIMKSTLQAAVKIQAWITDEVMPTIRKTGGAYIKPGSQAEFDLTNPETALDKLIEVAKVARDVIAKNKALEAKVLEDQPKVEFSEGFEIAENLLSFEATAKILNEVHGIVTGRNRLIWSLGALDILRKEGGTWVPYQRYLDKFKVQITHGWRGNERVVHYTTRVKASSIPWIVKKLKELDERI